MNGMTLLNLVSRRAPFALMALILTTSLYAQPQAVTRVEGLVLDEESGIAVGCKIYVYNPAGKRVQSLSSNTDDGSYLVVLNDAGPHKFVMGGHNVYRKEYEVTVPKSSKFQELKQNFTVRSFRQGAVLYQGVAFEKNSAQLSAEGRHGMETILAAMTDNQQLQIEVDLYPDEDAVTAMQDDSTRAYAKDMAAWEKAMKAYEKKYKKAKTKPEPPAQPQPRGVPADPNMQLLQDRKAVVTSFLKDARNVELRVKVNANALPPGLAKQAISVDEAKAELTRKKPGKTKAVAPAKGKAAPTASHNSLVVKVGEVKRLFGD